MDFLSGFDQFHALFEQIVVLFAACVPTMQNKDCREGKRLKNYSILIFGSAKGKSTKIGCFNNTPSDLQVQVLQDCKKIICIC